MDPVPRILITPGEPAGIGPDVTIDAATRPWPAELIAVGSAELLRARAEQLGIPLTLEVIDWAKPATAHKPHHLKIFPLELNTACIAGQLNVENSSYVIKTLELATLFCMHKKANALVTGPVQKSIINAADIPFTGHTEYLAALCHVEDPIMLFVIDNLRVALMTTHIPLREVAESITQEKLEKILRLLHQEMKIKFHTPHPKILVTGLNPHAGESGNLGREEIEIIIPVIEKLRAENYDVAGPMPADTIFIEKNWKTADVILAMYHDQALPVVKYLGFERAVNVTLGLPIIRTSVDHGTALDIAGSKNADAGSLRSAIALAIELC